MSDRQNSKPSLSVLSFVLRHKELWPKGFRWDYASCETCAIGLAQMMWPKEIKQYDLGCMIDAFGMKPQDAGNIFLTASKGYSSPTVSPERVADLIDAL